MGGFLGIKARSDHRFAADNLSAYLDGQLSAQEKERLERHLAACPDCRQELSTLRETVALLHQVPMRPVPRSFALPVSVQAEQAQHRHWNMAHSFMRGATIVVSLLLVLVVSGDVLLAQGVIGIPDILGSPSAKMAIQKENTNLQAETLQEESATDRAAPEIQAAPDEGMVAASAEAASAEAADTATEEKEMMGGGESAVTTEEAQPEMRAVAPDVEGDQVEAPQEGASIVKTMGATPENEATAEEEPIALALAAPEEAPEATQLELEAASPATENEQAPETYGETDGQEAADLPTGTEAAQKRDAEALAPPHPLSPMWTVWQTLRVVALGLGGLLLVLISGLLWSGHKRQL